jgi:hypothetical protein
MELFSRHDNSYNYDSTMINPSLINIFVSLSVATQFFLLFFVFSCLFFLLLLLDSPLVRLLAIVIVLLRAMSRHCYVCVTIEQLFRAHRHNEASILLNSTFLYLHLSSPCLLLIVRWFHFSSSFSFVLDLVSLSTMIYMTMYLSIYSFSYSTISRFTLGGSKTKNSN